MPVDHVWLTLMSLLEGELDEHPLMPQVRLYCSRRRWPKPACLIAAAGLMTLSCAHPVAPALPTEPAAWLLTGEVVPGKPFEGQSLAPCAKWETELHGGCWGELAVRPDKNGCPAGLYESGGKCYLPLKKPTPVPRSLTP